MSVRVVLDTRALLAWLRLDGAATGELLAMVAEGGEVAAVSALSVLAVHPHLARDDLARLRLLVHTSDGPAAVAPLTGGDALSVADIISAVRGDQALAHAVVLAREHDALLATVDGAAARAVLHPDDVLDL